MKVKQDELLSLLKRAGLALYGERWKRAIADDLGVTYRTLQNWLNSTYAAKPADILPKLLILLQQRERQIDNLVDEVSRGMDS